MTTLDAKEPAWSDPEMDALKTLWQAGLSASQIAAKLGTGKSRNAVIGKVHRLHLSGHQRLPAPAAESRERVRPPKPQRPAPSMPAARQKPSLAPLVRAKALVVLAPAPVELADGRITVVTLEPGMCKWPIGDPGTDDFSFCGHAQREGSPYCRYHAEKAYSGSVTNHNLKRSTRDNVLLKLAAR